MKNINSIHGTKSSKRGGAMVMAALAITAMSVLAMGMVSIQFSGSVEQHRTQEEARAVLAAEAGLSAAYMDLQNDGAGNLGTVNQPVSLASGEVVVTSQTFGPTLKLVRVTSTATVGTQNASAELILRDNVDSLFVWGAFGDTDLKLSSQAKVDSYDSTAGTYASQMVNGSGSNAWANDEGNVGSNGNVEVKQNAIVMGAATPGETSTISVVGNATVSGSTANATSAVVFPPIVLPVIPSTGNMTFAADTTLASGSYHFDTTVVNTGKTVTVTGPATLVFDSFELKSNSNFLVDSTNGPVEIYVLNNFILNSGTMIRSLDYDPRDVSINLLSDNIIDPAVVIILDNLAFDSNAKLYGTIYGPDARVKLDSNFEVFGAIIAEEVVLASNSRVHYDEALGQMLDPNAQRYTRLTWRAMHN
jgi:hypothetical protein